MYSVTSLLVPMIMVWSSRSLELAHLNGMQPAFVLIIPTIMNSTESVSQLAAVPAQEEFSRLLSWSSSCRHRLCSASCFNPQPACFYSSSFFFFCFPTHKVTLKLVAKNAGDTQFCNWRHPVQTQVENWGRCRSDNMLLSLHTVGCVNMCDGYLLIPLGTSLLSGMCAAVFFCPSRSFVSHWECFRSGASCLPDVTDSFRLCLFNHFSLIFVLLLWLSRLRTVISIRCFIS